MKTQTVRLIDVLVLGPFMMWAAARLSSPAREAMWAAGVLTIIYNGANYGAVRQGKEPLP